MADKRDYYDVLGVSKTASQDEIKEAYRALSETYSLDTFKDSPEEPLAEDKLSELNEAYSILINDVKYKDIRKLIESEQFINAENFLIIQGFKELNELRKDWRKALTEEEISFIESMIKPME